MLKKWKTSSRHDSLPPFLALLLTLAILLTGCAGETPAGDRAEFDAYMAELDEERQDGLYWNHGGKDQALRLRAAF